MEDSINPTSTLAAASSVAAGMSFFPCLKYLTLNKLPKLTTWWAGSLSSPLLSRLRRCEVHACPEMICIPLCPCVKILDISDTKRSLEMTLIEDASSSSSQQRELTIRNLGSLKLVPVENIQFATTMCVEYDEEVESLSQVGNFFQNYFSSTLRILKLSKCPKIKSLCGGIEYLSGLSSLCITECPNLLSNKDEEHDCIPWIHLSQTLHSLELMFYAVKNLPEGMKYLTSLQALELSGCQQLISMPTWMPKLTSLKLLTIRDSSEQLKKRCYQPNGEDWHLIHHISRVTLL